MKEFYIYLKKKWGVITLFIIWLPITFFNTKIYWMLVDDGWDVVFVRTLFDRLKSLNLSGLVLQLLEPGGRFRPVYWFYHMLVWIIGRNSFEFHHFVHMLVIGITDVFIYLILHELTKSKVISLFASLFYFLIPLNTENILRLGPQEPIMAMLFAIFFYLLISNKKVFATCFILVLAVFTKETSVAILPVLLIYYLYKRRTGSKKERKRSFYFLTTICASSFLMVVTTFLRRSGYSTNYIFDASTIIKNIIIFFRELQNGSFYISAIVPFIYLGRVIYKLTKKEKILESKIQFYEFLFFTSFISFITIQLPWAYALTRYLMPSILFLTLFSFVEIYQCFQIFTKIRFIRSYVHTFTLTLILIGAYTLSMWFFNVVSIEQSALSNREMFQKMAKYPTNITIFMNMKKGESTIELVDETQIHLSEFWGRDDLKVKYLELSRLPKDSYVVIDSDQFPRAYANGEINKLFNNKYLSINNESKRLVLTTPLELVKQTIKKTVNLILFKHAFTSDGIYTYYYNHNSWSFYNEK